MNPVLFLGIYTLFCGLSIAATGDEFNLGNDISITHDLTSSSEEENVEVYSKEVAGSAAERYPVRYSAPSADSRITSPDERSTERNTKQKRQRRKKLRLEGAHAAEINQTRRIKYRRKKIKNRNRSIISQPAANQSSKSDNDEGYPPSSPRSSNEINSEAQRRKSRKYGQMRRKVQYSEVPVAQDSPGSVQNVETNSVSLENSSNQDEDIEMQMKQKTKVSRGGKRREKIRLRDQKRKLRLVAREEKRRLLQEKREARRRRKLERMEKQKDLEAGRENAGEHQRRKKKKNPKNGTRMEATGNFMAAPSIDYFVEKSSNYVDTNDSPPFEVIGVSVESPSRAIVSSEAEADTAPGKLQKEKVSPVPPADEIVEHHQKVEEGITIEGDVNFTDSGDRREDGDLSCLRDDFQPAPEVAHADIKYLRNDEEGKRNPVLEAEYICHHGYKLQFDSSESSSINRSNIYCKDGRWVGYPPSCVRIKDLTAFNETCNYPSRCEQLCYVRNGVEKCACHKGFRLKDNRCQDVNECMGNKSLCEFGCINTVGSYRCKCPKGLKAGDARSCIDINECLLRNGHGPCQDTCINTWGGYKCSCDGLPGSRLSPDGHSCVDDDECSVNNGGCSHTCLNTMGRAFCLCPEGWVLDKDWKTCVDVDECAEQYADSSEQRCEFGCINTPGSYSCLVDFGADQPIHDEPPKCPDGYYRNSTTEDCQDINECAENNGGCFHRCVNTIGSFHCSCQPGFVFGPDKHTCIAINSSTDVSCPPLFPPKHGYLECSRPIASDIIGTDANGLGGRQRITNRPGSQCVLRCPTGFRISGKFSKQCSTSGIWIGESEGTCIRYPTPKLICPPDIVLETPPNETMVKLRIPRPKTDVNYDRDVSISPGWLRNSEVTLEVGTSNITYTARHPVSKLSVSCTFTVTVLEGEPPIVKFCPETQKYTLSKQHDSIKIAWNEPIFWDNVNVTEISRTNSPGNSFGVGSHQIVYVAKDQAGYVTRCVFKILVNVPYRPTLNHPLPIYHMFYK